MIFPNSLGIIHVIKIGRESDWNDL